MTDSFRLLIAGAKIVQTDWPNVFCFAVNGVCAKCRNSGEVYGLNKNGELETKYRYQITEFRCLAELDGETMPQGQEQNGKR